MKILKAQIVNFGKLQNTEFSFQDGINQLIHENGWGKTTLAVFIKAMFYGMGQSRSKNLEENERVKYFPWQGGTYGGTLSFEYQGEIYEINRTFGKKPTEDSFELIDKQSNKRSIAFGENLGEELFGVNRETYERSLHIVLEKTPFGSADISAKLSNLIETGDIGAYDSAIKTLKDKASALKKRGGNDILSGLLNKIDENNRELVDIEDRISQNKNFEQAVNEAEKKLQSLKEDQNKVNEEHAKNANYEKKIRYMELEKNKIDIETKIRALDDFFNGRPPSSEALKTIDETLKNIINLEDRLKSGALSQSEQYTYKTLLTEFSGDCPSEKAITLISETHALLQRFRQLENEVKLHASDQNELELLSKKYSGKDITQEKISSYFIDIPKLPLKRNHIESLKQTIAEKKDRLKEQERKRSRKKLAMGLLILAALLATAGGFLLFVPQTDPWSILVLVLSLVVVLIASGVLLVLKPKQLKVNELEKTLEEDLLNLSGLSSEVAQRESEFSFFIKAFLTEAPADLASLQKISREFSRYSELLDKKRNYQRWLAEQADDPRELETKIKTFLRRYCNDDNIDLFSSMLQRLQGKIHTLQSLTTKSDAYNQNNVNYIQTKEQLEKILSQFKTEKTTAFSYQVQEIHKHLSELASLISDKDKVEDKIKIFQDSEAELMEELERITKPEKNIEELKGELERISKLMEAEQYSLTRNKNLIEENNRIIDKKEDIDSEVDRLKEELKLKEAEHEKLTKTLKLLEAAKGNLDKNYSDPIKRGFEKYIKLLGTQVSMEIDTDLQVTIKGEGQRHHSDHLSAGYKDLVNFCTRLALVDALYTDRKPCLIIDDPFVNLDDDKVPEALNLIAEIAKDRQIIYFACHQSRFIA